MEVYDASEVRRLLGAAKTLQTVHSYTLLLMALHTGLRLGELLAVQWGDIDLEERQLMVRRNFSHGQLNFPKSDEVRRVELSETLCKELRQYRRTVQEFRLREGKNEIPEWVFYSKAGTLLDAHDVTRRVYHKARKKAELRHLSFHGLRDTYAAQLLMSGTPLAFVAKQLGQGDPAITLKYYMKYMPTQERSALQALEETVNGGS